MVPVQALVIQTFTLTTEIFDDSFVTWSSEKSSPQVHNGKSLPPPQIKDARSAYRGDVDIPDLDEPPEERELDLKPFASAWDLKMFREAKVGK